MKWFWTLIFIFCLIFVASAQLPISPKPDSSSFINWKADRIEQNFSPFGWVSLTGLYWINSDTINLGSSRKSDFIFPQNAPPELGMIVRSSEQYIFYSSANTSCFHERDSIDSIALEFDVPGPPTVVSHKSLFWYLIKRGDKIGMRVKDTMLVHQADKIIESFEFNPEFIKLAEVEWATQGESIAMDNVLGQSTDSPILGWLHFMHEGQRYTLTGIDNGDGNWFIVFADITTSELTYGGGRFLYVPVPKKASKIWLDLNKAENPPCFFSAFATCPLPPNENKLTFKVLAGEKSNH